jgi:thiol-disulfide isomerase/thioredoxin
LVVVGLAVACGAASARSEPGGDVGNRAPEFQGIANWINSEPLTMEDLRGKVVLIDFWTYTCVNCIRTMPYLREWHDKYAKEGLVIVGVHAPEFEFEKLTENVKASVENFDLTYPIAQDNEMGTWRAYSNRAWPAKYLVGKDGFVRYKHFGEGSYQETERQIRNALRAAGASLSDVWASTADEPQFDPEARSRDLGKRITREIYGGFRRNNSRAGLYVVQSEYYEGPGRAVDYEDPEEHNNHYVYLQGPWFNGLEELRHGRETENYEDYLALKFSATTVNAVINADDAPPFKVRVTIDGRPLQSDEAGPDVVVSDEGSFITVDEPRLYEVVALPAYSSHELKLSSNSKDFALFAFTFGAYEEGP